MSSEVRKLDKIQEFSKLLYNKQEYEDAIDNVLEDKLDDKLEDNLEKNFNKNSDNVLDKILQNALDDLDKELTTSTS